MLTVFAHEYLACVRATKVILPSWWRGRSSPPPAHTTVTAALGSPPGGHRAALLSGRESPADLHGEDTPGTCPLYLVSQSCPQGPSHRAAAPSEQLASSARANAALSEIIRAAYREGKLVSSKRTHTHGALLSSAKITGGTEG